MTDLLPSDGNNRLTTGRNGVYLYNKNDVYIGRSIEAYGEFSGAEGDFIESTLGSGDIVIEVGANIGAHSVGIARKVGPSGRLIAFEPQRIVFQMLCANVALNDLRNVDCYQQALGAKPGTVLVPEMDFSKPNNFGGVSVTVHPAGRPVPCRVMDAFHDLPRLRLVKIDVEGMEADVISGGKATIAKLRPLIYVENDHREQSQALITLIGGLGYELYWHLPPLFRPNNFRRNPTNVFGNIASINMLCLPREQDRLMPGLRKVTGPMDNPALGA